MYLRNGVGRWIGVHPAALQKQRRPRAHARRVARSRLSSTSRNGYSTSQIYNGHRYPGAFHLDYVPTAGRDALVRGLCAGETSAVRDMEKIKAGTAGCPSFVDGENAEVRVDIHLVNLAPQTIEDLKRCLMAWPPLSSPRALKVSVHVRWGDNAGRYPAFFYGSMSIPNINRVLYSLTSAPSWDPRGRSTYTRDAGILARLNVNATAGAFDILLLSESSYGVLAHLIAPPAGLTIVDNQGQN
ncbi:hypothetical protein B0H11DRAFT_2213937 [Mycena galericulata]|nr:hypothetical protein B0H11DRAFT_2213937 [Mycena galericulata]